MNEDLNFEYGDDTVAVYGCGATLHNVFWYFGGSGQSSKRRQVKLQNYSFNINLFISGQQNCRMQAAASRRFKF